jgi:hypothetical protein
MENASNSKEVESAHSKEVHQRQPYAWLHDYIRLCDGTMKCGRRRQTTMALQ